MVAGLGKIYNLVDAGQVYQYNVSSSWNFPFHCYPHFTSNFAACKYAFDINMYKVCRSIFTAIYITINSIFLGSFSVYSFIWYLQLYRLKLGTDPGGFQGVSGALLLPSFYLFIFLIIYIYNFFSWPLLKS